MNSITNETTIFLDYEFLKALFLEKLLKTVNFINLLIELIVLKELKLKSNNEKKIKIAKIVVKKNVELYCSHEIIDFNVIKNLYEFQNLNKSKSEKLNNILMFLNSNTLVFNDIYQSEYIDILFKNEIVFGMGPVRNGKSYIAVASLFFCLDDLKEKMEPYLRLLYGALYEFLGERDIEKISI